MNENKSAGGWGDRYGAEEENELMVVAIKTAADRIYLDSLDMLNNLAVGEGLLYLERRRCHHDFMVENLAQHAAVIVGMIRILSEQANDPFPLEQVEAVVLEHSRAWASILYEGGSRDKGYLSHSDGD